MSTEIEEHITKKYEIKKRLGKGVSFSLTRCSTVAVDEFALARKLSCSGLFSRLNKSSSHISNIAWRTPSYSTETEPICSSIFFIFMYLEVLFVYVLTRHTELYGKLSTEKQARWLPLRRYSMHLGIRPMLRFLILFMNDMYSFCYSFYEGAV